MQSLNPVDINNNVYFINPARGNSNLFTLLLLHTLHTGLNYTHKLSPAKQGLVTMINSKRDTNMASNFKWLLLPNRAGIIFKGL